MKLLTMLATLFIFIGIAAASYVYPGDVDIKGDLVVGGEIDQLGNLSNLTTSVETDLVTALNEVDSNSDGLQDAAYLNETAINSSIGSLTDAAYLNETAINSSISTLQGYVSHFSVIAGGAAGNHTLTGVAVGDELGGVAYFAKGTENLTAVSDLSSEFTILDDDIIENAAHTNTSGGYLGISWIDKTA